MYFGADLVVMVKTNIKVFYKETIEKIINDWPLGS